MPVYFSFPKPCSNFCYRILSVHINTETSVKIHYEKRANTTKTVNIVALNLRLCPLSFSPTRKILESRAKDNPACFVLLCTAVHPDQIIGAISTMPGQVF